MDFQAPLTKLMARSLGLALMCDQNCRFARAALAEDSNVGRTTREILARRQNQPARGRFHPQTGGRTPLRWVEQASGLLRRASRPARARRADGLAKPTKPLEAVATTQLRYVGTRRFARRGSAALPKLPTLLIEPPFTRRGLLAVHRAVELRAGAGGQQEMKLRGAKRVGAHCGPGRKVGRCLQDK